MYDLLLYKITFDLSTWSDEAVWRSAGKEIIVAA